MNKEEQIFIHHCHDLSNRTYEHCYPLFTNFLNQNEISLLKEVEDDFMTSVTLYGGFEDAERRMACFHLDAFSLSTEVYPISILMITSAYKKENLSSLTHRDVLGAFMHLGIEREMIGDILLYPEKIYIFCVADISSVVLTDLSKIGHQQIRIKEIPNGDFSYTPNFNEVHSQISSNRLDAFLSEACHISRKSSVEYILAGKVFINSKMIDNYSKKLEEGDILSIRGFGKIKFSAFEGISKKGKIKIAFFWYQ